MSLTILKLLRVPALFLSITVSFGQSGSATLSGKITDPSGAVVANAVISAVNTATHLERRANTSIDGLYVLPVLSPGKYIVTAQQKGFASETINEVVLETGSRRTGYSPETRKAW